MHSSASINVNAHILTKLTSTLPSVVCQPREWPHLSSLQLADPNFCDPQPIDILVGADVYGQIIKPKIIRFASSSPIAQSTIFGWIIIGPTAVPQVSTHQVYHTAVASSDKDLRDLLLKFWTQEEVQSSTSVQLTPEEQMCENHFRSTHSRDEAGRYIVRIPLTSSTSQLGTSSLIAQRCLHRLMKKLSTNDSFNQLYSTFMKEYEELGHMVCATHQSNPVSAGCKAGMTLAHDVLASGGLRVLADQSVEQIHAHPPYYMPHHGVLKEDSTTTKLRVVFNGSSPTSSGLSINDIQHVGAKIQRDLADILIWIRQHKYIFSTDVTKMYRQVKVHPDDWDLQQIMWNDDQENMVPYQLTTVTYGTRSAPFLAIRALLQLVEDEGHRFPLAIDPLINGRYVDDIFGGSDNIQTLIDTSKQVTQLCKAGGFPLAKWHSNSKDFIIQQSNLSNQEIHSFEESNTKILGLSWIPHYDVFKFHSKLPTSGSKITKRIILSETAQLYDPLGFLSPIIIRAKALLQELWLDKLHWDAPIPERLKGKWTVFRQELMQISEISIPRWIKSTQSSTIELHGFSDASQIAMAAAIYVKIQNPDQPAVVSLICAKSKVAPLKRITIPRLELSAALILAKLMKYVKSVLHYDDVPTHLWTDSSVALTWIHSHPSRWKDFVRNRVSSIQELTPNSVWRFIPGKANPADCASRGISVSQLSTHQLWWTGPPWLLNSEDSWPDQPISYDSKIHQEEEPGLSFTVASPQYQWEIIYRYSSLVKLLRITAICFRVFQIAKRMPHSTLAVPLMPQEINRSRVLWIKATQAVYFAQEFKLISSAQLPKTHPFNRLTAYVDTHGIIRVGGRLSNSLLEPEAIHPAILPRHSHFTTLIIADAHQRTLHGGTQLTLNHIRQSY